MNLTILENIQPSTGKPLPIDPHSLSRLEERRLRTTTLLTPLFEREWSGIGQTFQLRRRTTHPLKCPNNWCMASLT
jgi:hypothetical protein